jgi:hypothetical protein
LDVASRSPSVVEARGSLMLSRINRDGQRQTQNPRCCRPELPFPSVRRSHVSVPMMRSRALSEEGPTM